MSLVSNLLRNKPEGTAVFSLADVAQITGVNEKVSLEAGLIYAKKTGQLERKTRGIYVLPNYSRWELGNKIYRPSYISLYSVLAKEGVVFQFYKSVFLVSCRSKTVEVDGQKYVYRKIKNKILLNNMGLVSLGNVTVAGVERALADKIYLDGVEYFDNLRNVNWEFLRALNREVYGGNRAINSFIKKYEGARYKNT